MTYEYYNPNPNGKTVSDCVIRAISKALNQSWETTYIELALQGYLMGDLPNANAVWSAYLKNKGFHRDVVSNDCPDCYTITDFAEEHPNGTYIIGTGTHAVAVVDGVIYDAWRSDNEQPIYFFYRQES